MLNIGLPELVVIFLIIFLLFGAKALPEVAKGLGQAIKIFRKEAKEFQEQIEDAKDSAKLTAGPDNQTKREKRDNSHDFKPDANRPDWRPPSSPPDKTA